MFRFPLCLTECGARSAERGDWSWGGRWRQSRWQGPSASVSARRCLLAPPITPLRRSSTAIVPMRRTCPQHGLHQSFSRPPTSFSNASTSQRRAALLLTLPWIGPLDDRSACHTLLCFRTSAMKILLLHRLQVSASNPMAIMVCSTVSWYTQCDRLPMNPVTASNNIAHSCRKH
jgi:hypothetical protein